MSGREAEQLGRLRAELELRAGLVRALRLETEQQRERSSADAALIAEISADICRLSAETSRRLEQSDICGAQRALREAQALCTDLADYGAARAGSLAPHSRPVNLRRLVVRALGARGPTAEVAAEVPERVCVDERLLERLLRCFVDRAGVQADGRLEVIAEETPGSAEGNAVCVVEFRLYNIPLCAAASDSAQGAAGRMRLALIDAVGRSLGATITPDSLRVPLSVAEDPAATGLHRLQIDEPADASRNAALPEAEHAEAVADDPVDLVYLDQQLGSLAPVILRRTAPAFLAEAQRRMTDLHVAFESGQAERLRVVAQGWRGSALTVGARPLASLLESMERQLGSGGFPSEPMMWQVRLALDRVVRSLTGIGSREGLGV